MNADQFKVIYTGNIKDGFNIESVAQQFATRFKITPEKASTILQSGREITLNKKAEHIKAYKLKSAFEEIGMQVRLERILLLVSNEDIEDQQQEKNEDEEKKPVDVPSDAINTINKASDSWTLDPIHTNNDDDLEETNSDHEPTNSDVENQPKKIEKEDFNYTGLSNSPVINSKKPEKETKASSSKQKNSDENTDEEEKEGIGSLLIGLVKDFGAITVGIVVTLVIVLKKFGFLKILKIGFLATAASFAGFESEELCMGSDRCEDIIDDQIGICWEDKGYDDYEWDEMSDEEYWNIKPALETEVLACFIDTDTAERLFVSPIEVRLSLIFFCSETGIKQCEEIVEPQIMSCYNQHKVGEYVNAQTTDYFQVVAENPKVFEEFYQCFVDENGNQIIQSYF